MTDTGYKNVESEVIAGDDVMVDGKVVGQAAGGEPVEDDDDLWYKESEQPVGGEGLTQLGVVVGGELRATTLASSARRKDEAEAKAEQEAQEQKAARARVAPDKSSNTRWAQPTRRQGPETLWHAYGYIGPYQTVSYCGVEHLGSFRRSPPPRDNAVCEKCAAACGFVRRSRRVKGERQRGSRRLGNIVDRMEVAVERSETNLERMNKEMDGLERAMERLGDVLDRIDKRGES